MHLDMPTSPLQLAKYTNYNVPRYRDIVIYPVTLLFLTMRFMTHKRGGFQGVACAVLCNNSYAAPWLTTLFVGCGYALSAFMAKLRVANILIGK